MNWIRTLTAVVATVGLSAVAQAGIFDLGALGAGKSCGCASTEQPACCKPTITRPCEPTVHTYQRQISKLKKPCCKPKCCDTAPKSCCAPAAKACCAPAAKCAPKACAAPAAKCAPKACAAPAAKCAPKACCAPAAKTCCAPAQKCCPTRCCDADPCEIAELIYESQTACYAKDRRKAIHKLGDNFDCVCNPEIMDAMVYALNDCDERVRAKAADEIGDQIRDQDGCCNCCTKKVIAALTAALGDCDDDVRDQAEEALEECGFEIVDGCCEVACCNNGCGTGGAAAPTPAKGAAPAPVPPKDSAYFPSRLNRQQTRKSSRLSQLLGFLD